MLAHRSHSYLLPEATSANAERGLNAIGAADSRPLLRY
jgi:hypothetical protein